MKATGCMQLYGPEGWYHFPVRNVYDPRAWAESLRDSGVSRVCVILTDPDPDMPDRYADYGIDELAGLTWLLADGTTVHPQKGDDA